MDGRGGGQGVQVVHRRLVARGGQLGHRLGAGIRVSGTVGCWSATALTVPATAETAAAVGGASAEDGWEASGAIAGWGAGPSVVTDREHHRHPEPLGGGGRPRVDEMGGEPSDGLAVGRVHQLNPHRVDTRWVVPALAAPGDQVDGEATGRRRASAAHRRPAWTGRNHRRRSPAAPRGPGVRGRVDGRALGARRRVHRLVEGRDTGQAGVHAHRHRELCRGRPFGTDPQLDVEQPPGRHPGGSGTPGSAGRGEDEAPAGVAAPTAGRGSTGNTAIAAARAAHTAFQPAPRAHTGTVGLRSRRHRRAPRRTTPTIGADPSPVGTPARGWLPQGHRLPRSRSTSDATLRQFGRRTTPAHYPRRRVPRATATVGGGHRRPLRALPVGRPHPLPGGGLGPRRHRLGARHPTARGAARPRLHHRRPPDAIEALVSGWADSVWTQGKRFGTIGCRRGRADLRDHHPSGRGLPARLP